MFKRPVFVFAYLLSSNGKLFTYIPQIHFISSFMFDETDQYYMCLNKDKAQYTDYLITSNGKRQKPSNKNQEQERVSLFQTYNRDSGTLHNYKHIVILPEKFTCFCSVTYFLSKHLYT